MNDNYIKLIVPTPEGPMTVERLWFFKGENCENALYEAQFALKDANKRFSDVEWKSRPRIVAYRAMNKYPLMELVGF